MKLRLPNMTFHYHKKLEMANEYYKLYKKTRQKRYLYAYQNKLDEALQIYQNLLKKTLISHQNSSSSGKQAHCGACPSKPGFS